MLKILYCFEILLYIFTDMKWGRNDENALYCGVIQKVHRNFFVNVFGHEISITVFVSPCVFKMVLISQKKF